MSPPQSPYASPPQGYQAYTPPPVQTKTNSLAIVAVVSIFIFPVVSGIFGFIALKQIKNSNGAEKGEGMAIAGIVVGGLILFGLLVAALGG